MLYLAILECFLDLHLLLIVGFAPLVAFSYTRSDEAILRVPPHCIILYIGTVLASSIADAMGFIDTHNAYVKSNCYFFFAL